VILRADDVVALQFFLMDVAKRYTVPCLHCSEPSDLLGSAAALDYPLMVAREAGGEFGVKDAATLATAATIGDIIGRCALAAVLVIEAMIAEPDVPFDDFATRHGRAIFDTLRSLAASGALRSEDLMFRALTARSDLLERLRVRRSS
jgi:hypothetical protein